MWEAWVYHIVVQAEDGGNGKGESQWNSPFQSVRRWLGNFTVSLGLKLLKE